MDISGKEVDDDVDLFSNDKEEEENKMEKGRELNKAITNEATRNVPERERTQRSNMRGHVLG